MKFSAAQSICFRLAFFCLNEDEEALKSVVMTGARIVGEPVASGLALDDSGLWDPDFETAAK